MKITVAELFEAFLAANDRGMLDRDSGMKLQQALFGLSNALLNCHESIEVPDHIQPLLDAVK